MQVLSLHSNATEADIKRQYRKLAAQVHPDKCHLEGAEEAFKLLGRAVAHAIAAADTDRYTIRPLAADSCKVLETKYEVSAMHLCKL